MTMDTASEIKGNANGCTVASRVGGGVEGGGSPSIFTGYYDRPEVSNSDLSWLKRYFEPGVVLSDTPLRFGTLVDAILTEPEKVDYFKKKVIGLDYQFSTEDFLTAQEMARSFFKNKLCSQVHSLASGQAVRVYDLPVEYGHFNFTLKARCKYDLWSDTLRWGADIKTTTCTTQAQFEEAVRHFDYDRQRAWYMDISGADHDVIIGLSKINFKVFIVPVTRAMGIYKSGLEKYQELAFRWWMLFE